MEQRTCLTCGEKIKGRADKKFCDDHCRTSYNNRINNDLSGTVKRINTVLKKNRKILHDFLEHATDGKMKVAKNKLTDKGFNFLYNTHMYKTQTAKVYHFCYEYGLLQLENEAYLIIKRVP